jgi:hypothetical protein
MKNGQNILFCRNTHWLLIEPTRVLKNVRQQRWKVTDKVKAEKRRVCSTRNLNLGFSLLHMVEPSRKRPQGSSWPRRFEARGQGGLRFEV